MPAPTLLVPGSLKLSTDLSTARVSRDIPVLYITSWLKHRMPEYGYQKAMLKDRILIVRAETGSGKSTVLPVEIFRILRNKDTPIATRYNGGNVICTQPRILTAISLSNDVSGRPWNPDMILGQTVGYQTGPITNKPNRGLLYATAGILATQLEYQSDSHIMELYRFILIDEAHERSQDCDMTLMLLKNFYLRNIGNKNLPFLILTSATFNITRYATYFGIGLENTIEVIGRTYPIETYWPLTNCNDYAKAAADIALKIHQDNYSDNSLLADILISMPGQKEITLVLEHLNMAISNDKNTEIKNPLDFLIISISGDNIKTESGDFRLLFEKIEKLPKIFGKPPKRRIIVSTVVAETGLTVDTLKYVIDAGWSRTTEIYQPWEIGGLITRPAPQSRIKQRKGRVGRMFPGNFYPLYTENVYKSLDEQQLPDIISIGIKEKFLKLIGEQQKQKVLTKKKPEFIIEDISLLDPPAIESFIMANATANLLGFLSFESVLPKHWPPNFDLIFNIKYGCGLTYIGYIASIFSISMESIRMILMGYVYDIAAEDLLNIAIIIGVTKRDIYLIKELNSKNIGDKILMDVIADFKGSDSIHNCSELKLLLMDDILEMLLIYNHFLDKVNKLTINELFTWCKNIGINFKTFMTLTEKRDDIIEEMYIAGLDPFRLEKNKLKNNLNNETIIGLKKCIYGGYMNNILKYENNNYFTNQKVKVKVLNLEKNTKPKWIITDLIKLVPVKSLNPEKPAPLLYDIEANMISVIDGFFYPDINYTFPTQEE